MMTVCDAQRMGASRAIAREQVPGSSGAVSGALRQPAAHTNTHRISRIVPRVFFAHIFIRERATRGPTAVAADEATMLAARELTPLLSTLVPLLAALYAGRRADPSQASVPATVTVTRDSWLPEYDFIVGECAVAASNCVTE